MSEKFWTFGPLDSADTFEGLARVAKAHRGLPPDGLSCTFESANAIKLWVAPPGKNDKALDGLFRKEFGKGVSTTEVLKNRLTLDVGLVRMLMDAELPRGTAPAEPILKEYMLFGYGMDNAKFERASHVLRSPNIRAQVARGNDGEVPVSLFYLRDKSEQQDPAQGIEKFFQGQLSEYSLLRAYQVGKHILFLPLNKRVSQILLEQFTNLVLAAPQLWHKGAEKNRSEFLFAVERIPNQANTLSNRFRYSYLAHLEFVTQDLSGAQIEIHRLEQSAQDLEELTEKVRKAQVPWGYALELHRMEQTGPTRAAHDVELVRRRINELQALVAYLESVQVERPRLLRFTQKQLPALANVLTNYPQTLLAAGRIRYGFESNPLHPEGLHYLLIPPGTDPMARPNPVLLWAHLDMCDMRFWLDPYWAKEYYDPAVIKTGQEPPYLVFVPEWTAMYPAFHEWDIEMMGQDAAKFLRESVEQWSDSKPKNPKATGKEMLPAPEVPNKPFYLLDNSGQDGHPIQISVLDSDRFVPLKSRLDWLNQNLFLQSELGNAEFIARIADYKEREELTREYQLRTLDAEMRFKQHADTVELGIAQTMTDMTTQVSERLNGLNREIREAFDEIRKLNAELQKLRTDYGELSAARENVEKGFQDTQSFLADLEKNAKELETQSNVSIVKTQALRDAARKHVDDLVKELQADIANIRRRLSEPRWSR